MAGMAARTEAPGPSPGGGTDPGASSSFPDGYGVVKGADTAPSRTIDQNAIQGTSVT